MDKGKDRQKAKAALENILSMERRLPKDFDSQKELHEARMEKYTSKYLSLILRHKPEVIGISLDEHGWAGVDEVVAGIGKTRKFDRDMLEEIVRTDSKQRYTFNEDKTLIRANQGHSISVDVQLDAAKPPDILWHGTGEKYVSSIEKSGLLPKGRLYVHISADKETAYKVGQRHGRAVVYRVLAGAMWEDGYTFYRSKNGVWLTEKVPVQYLDCEVKDC